MASIDCAANVKRRRCMQTEIFIWTYCGFVYHTKANTASVEELVLRKHIESKHTLQPPKYITIIVKRFNYINNKITKNRGLILLDLNMMLGPYKFNMGPTVNHHGHSMNCGHYTTSINCCGKKIHCNDTRITKCNNSDKYNSFTAYMILHKLIV